CLSNSCTVQNHQHLLQQTRKIRIVFGSCSHHFDHACCIALGKSTKQFKYNRKIRSAQQGVDSCNRDTPTTKSNALVQQSQCIAHTAGCCTCQMPQGIFFKLNQLGSQHGLQIGDD